MWQHTSEEGRRWDERKASGGGGEGSVGVAVSELGRAPPQTEHIFVAGFSSAPTCAVLVPSNTIRAASEPGRGCPSSQDHLQHRGQLLCMASCKHRLLLALSNVVNEPNFRMKCCCCFVF